MMGVTIDAAVHELGLILRNDATFALAPSYYKHLDSLR